MQFRRARSFSFVLDYVPRGLWCIGRSKQCIARARVVVPAAVRFKVHGAQFPSPHRILDAPEKSPVLLLLADLKPVFDEDNAVVSQQRFESWRHAEEIVVLLVAAKTHHVFDQSAVVPGTVRTAPAEPRGGKRVDSRAP